MHFEPRLPCLFLTVCVLAGCGGDDGKLKGPRPPKPGKLAAALSAGDDGSDGEDDEGSRFNEESDDARLEAADGGPSIDVCSDPSCEGCLEDCCGHEDGEDCTP